MPLLPGELLEDAAFAQPGARIASAGAISPWRRQGSGSAAPRRAYPSDIKPRQRDSRRGRIAETDRSWSGAGTGWRISPRSPGKQAYMAPEMFEAEPGNEATEFTLSSVTIFRAFFPRLRPYGTFRSHRSAAPQPAEGTFPHLRPDFPPGSKRHSRARFAVDPAKRLSRMTSSPSR